MRVLKKCGATSSKQRTCTIMYSTVYFVKTKNMYYYVQYCLLRLNKEDVLLCTVLSTSPKQRICTIMYSTVYFT